MLFPDNFNIWLCSEPVDMRKQINGLSVIVADKFCKNKNIGDLFIFYNKNRSRIKILFYHYNGYCALQKILDKGIFKIPKILNTHMELNKNQLNRLLEGLYFSIDKKYEIFY